MKSKVLIITVSVLLAAISCTFAQSTTTTEAAWSPAATTESSPASQWSWTNFLQFIKNSTTGSGNKFYFFF
ncbi:hypothetical protein KR054_004913 [Drosophila jambulina]|nr:hypothetical protein KR054_004913 [Drosophila jambulina]